MGNTNSGRRPAGAVPDVIGGRVWHNGLLLRPFDDPPEGVHESMADRKVRLINQLTHTKGRWAGQPFNLRPWQEALVRRLFATNDAGERTIRQMLLTIGRKNGKSELCAALALDGLLWDNEPGAEVYSAAADREQAAIVFHIAAQMVRNDPRLLAECDIHDSTKKILHRKSGSVYRAISAEGYTKHGLNSSRIIYDELHAAPNRELWDVLITSVGARDQPLTIAISTAGYDRHSILWEIYSHAKKVIEDPALDPQFLAVLYEVPAEADWTCEEAWRLANPALGDFRSLEELRAACTRARQIPAQENSFRRLYLNQWTEQSSRWLQLAAWDACAALPGELARRTCYVGLDLSSTTDLTALVGVFPDESGGYDVKAEFFMPAGRVHDRVVRDRVPYDQWIRDGWITAAEGERLNYEHLRRRLLEWREAYDLREIAFDPWNADQFSGQLDETDGFVCVPIKQTFYGLSETTKALEADIFERRVRQDGNPVLRWCVQNVAIETNAAGEVKPSKAKSTERIDGVVALIMALDRVKRHARHESAFQLVML